MNYLIFTLLAALLLSLAMAMVEDRSPRERLSAAARLFSLCAIGVVGSSWLMRLIHG